MNTNLSARQSLLFPAVQCRCSLAGTGASHRTALPVCLALHVQLQFWNLALCGSPRTVRVIGRTRHRHKAASDLGLGLVLVQGQFLCAFWGIVYVVQ
jgi:hypothetical protein